MALVDMPNGNTVDVPDDISPDALARIKQQNTPTRQQLAAKGQPRTQANPQNTQVQQQADQRQKMGFGHGMMDSIVQGLTFGHGDELSGAAAGAMAIPGAIYHGAKHLITGQGSDGGQDVQQAYTNERDVQRELQQRYNNAHPIASTIGEIGGAVLNPVGTGEAALGGAGRLAGKTASVFNASGHAGDAIVGRGLERVAGALTNTGERVAASGAIPKAVLAGANQGALNAAGNADNLSDVPGALARGGVIGGVTGGALGGGAHLVGRGVQILRDAAPANAERTAYSRIAQLLDNGGTDANAVAAEIAATDRAGGDAMVGDMTPGLRAQAGAISRKPSVPSSNDLIDRGEQRIQDRRANFGQAVRNSADIPAIGDDALARGQSLAQMRKNDGTLKYAPGGVLDTKITPTPELQTYLNNAPAPVQDAMKSAYNEMLLRDESPADYVGANGIFTHIPNLRTFDYVKRGFDTQIGQALRSGDKATAQGLSFQLNKLKGVLADANPKDAEYQAVLAGQRDLFQKQNALDIGSNVLKQIGSQPRKVLADLKALEPHQIDDARVGIIDGLINSDNKADPVAYFRGLMRNDAQRKVMEFAFGGKGNLGRFERWVGREVRATRSDVLTAPGRQSETARFQMADSDASEATGSVLSNAMRGYAFGGTIGALSGVTRTLGNIATGTTKLGQDEIAKILLSKGQNLAKGVEGAQQFQAARQAGNKMRATTIGKAGQQIYTDQAGK